MTRTQGKILHIALAIAWVAAPVAAEDSTRGKRIAELKSFLAKKEKELARLTSIHSEKLRKADPLAKEVEKQKELQARGWFEQRALEKNLRKLRPQFEEIERIAAERRAVREESFAAASAIVSELESAMEEDLNSMRDEDDPSERKRLIESIQTLDRDRRIYQGKANRLMPTIPLPADLPSDVQWSDEMAEDICSAYAAAVARLESEREDILKEQRLRRSVAENIPNVVRPAGTGSHLEVALAEAERKLGNYREKLAGLCAGEVEGK